MTTPKLNLAQPLDPAVRPSLPDLPTPHHKLYLPNYLPYFSFFIVLAILFSTNPINLFGQRRHRVETLSLHKH